MKVCFVRLSIWPWGSYRGLMIDNYGSGGVSWYSYYFSSSYCSLSPYRWRHKINCRSQINITDSTGKICYPLRNAFSWETECPISSHDFTNLSRHNSSSFQNPDHRNPLCGRGLCFLVLCLTLSYQIWQKVLRSHEDFPLWKQNHVLFLPKGHLLVSSTKQVQSWEKK